MPVEIHQRKKSYVTCYKVMFAGEEAWWYGLKLDEQGDKLRLVEIDAVHKLWGHSSAGRGTLHVVDPADAVEDEIPVWALNAYRKWADKEGKEYAE